MSHCQVWFTEYTCSSLYESLCPCDAAEKQCTHSSPNHHPWSCQTWHLPRNAGPRGETGDKLLTVSHQQQVSVCGNEPWILKHQPTWVCLLRNIMQSKSSLWFEMVGTEAGTFNQGACNPWLPAPVASQWLLEAQCLSVPPLGSSKMILNLMEASDAVKRQGLPGVMLQ